MNEFARQEDEIEKIYAALPKNGINIIIKGEKGIGKRYLIDSFFEKHKDELTIIPIHCSIVSSTAYSALFAGLATKDYNRHLKIERVLQFANILSSLVGKFFSEGDVAPSSDSISKLPYKGPYVNPYNINKLVRYIEKFSKNKTICLHFDNLQWMDKESFEILLRVIGCTGSKKWINIITYTTNASITQANHFNHIEIDQLLGEFKSRSNRGLHVIEMQRWKKENISDLCSSLLLGNTLFTKKQYDVLFENTKGLPFYLKTILESFKENNIIDCTNNGWESSMDWNSREIRAILKNNESERIRCIYNKLPESQKILEFASAIGETFSDELVKNGLKKENTNTVLREVLQSFRLVEYLTHKERWKFDHEISRDSVYELSGDRNKKIHLCIAELLGNDHNKDYNKISEHYRLGGDKIKALKAKIEYIKQLFDFGIYNTASILVKEINKNSYEYNCLTNLEKYKYIILEGRSLFYNNQFDETVAFFHNTLNKSNITDLFYQAEMFKWLGKSYLKLSSKSDFEAGVESLEKALALYSKCDNYSESGYIDIELIVAYSRINDFSKAEKSFIKAQNHFWEAEDEIGMARLIRKSVMFKANDINALQIVLAAKNNFSNLPHEMIMSLNNAATLYIFAKQYAEAENLLKESIILSEKIADFGIVYLNNNWGVLECFRQNYEIAEEYFKVAKKQVFREVDKMVLEINIGAIIDKRTHGGHTLFLQKIYNKLRDTVGEDEYTIPAGINLARSYVVNEQYSQAIDILTEIEFKLSINVGYYKLKLWYSLIQMCYQKNKSYDLLDRLNTKYISLIVPERNQQPHVYDDYALLTLQFWSEN